MLCWESRGWVAGVGRAACLSRLLLGSGLLLRQRPNRPRAVGWCIHTRSRLHRLVFLVFLVFLLLPRSLSLTMRGVGPWLMGELFRSAGPAAPFATAAAMAALAAAYVPALGARAGVPKRPG